MAGAEMNGCVVYRGGDVAMLMGAFNEAHDKWAHDKCSMHLAPSAARAAATVIVRTQAHMA
jgi:hypothetical protein